MKITKYTHACIQIAHEDRKLVIDPGTWSEPGALIGAGAVLVTHEHIDHIDVLRLAGLGVPVFVPAEARIGPADIAAKLDIHRVKPGDAFKAAGFDVIATGGRHAHIHGEEPDCANVGYIVDGKVYHPGDSLHLPGQPIDTLCVPVQAGWLKLTEAIDFVRAVKPRQAIGIHDGQINERGLASVNGWLTPESEGVYKYLMPRESVETE